MNDEDTPHIEEPDELDDDHEKNGLMCFMDQDRQCGGDCMAFSTSPSESPHLGDQQKHCVLIVGLERTGRYAGGLLSLLKKDKADSARTPAKPVSPLGGS